MAAAAGGAAVSAKTSAVSAGATDVTPPDDNDDLPPDVGLVPSHVIDDARYCYSYCRTHELARRGHEGAIASSFVRPI